MLCQVNLDGQTNKWSWIGEGDAYVIILVIFVDSFDQKYRCFCYFKVLDKLKIFFTQMLYRIKNPGDNHLVLVIWKTYIYESMNCYVPN